jgi:hypothetical protein
VPITFSADSNRLTGSQLASSANANPAEEKEVGEIEEKVKDFEKIDGLFTMYRKVTDGRNPNSSLKLRRISWITS